LRNGPSAEAMKPGQALPILWFGQSGFGIATMISGRP
jgi:hypothetical protein